MLITLLLRRGGKVTMRDLRAHPEGVDLGPLEAGRLPAALHTKGKRLDLAPGLVLDDVRRLERRRRSGTRVSCC